MLPIAVYQPVNLVLKLRYREQAPSHICMTAPGDICVSKYSLHRIFTFHLREFARFNLSAKGLPWAPLKAGQRYSFSN